MDNHLLKQELDKLAKRVSKIEKMQSKLFDHLITTNYHLGLTQERIIRILERENK